MDFNLWLTFIAVYSVICISPGPSVFIVTSLALSNGKSTALLCVLGDLLGGVVLIALSLFGVGAILAASAVLFQLVKWAGVLYVAYLGICQITAARKSVATTGLPSRQTQGFTALKMGFLTGVLNPKAVIFYMAFLPQFMDPTAPAAQQFLILASTSTVIVGAVLSSYAIAAARARTVFNNPKAQRRISYTGGGFLLGSSVFMASTR
ncbi:MAG: LysE family translocator [Rhodobacteraceae bacterium]|nr:LysE family translocator [Paracoccaceae bacterium]